MKYIIKNILFSIIIFQLIIIYPIRPSHAGMGEKLRAEAHKLITGNLCKKMMGSNKKDGDNGITGEVGCEILKAIASDPKLLTEVVNMILLITMTLSLLNGKCKVTEDGKNLLPKSHTAGITHWIHKIASLIYIYAEIQNIITLRKLDKKYKNAAKVEGQANKFQALLLIQKAKLAAAKKKLKVLSLSSMGLGASAAIEIGMSAAFTGFGIYKKADEISECTISSEAAASCLAKGTSAVTANASNIARIKEVTSSCLIKLQEIATTDTLVKQAKKTVVSSVIKGISSAVGGAIGGQLAEGGSKGSRIVGATIGNVIGAKVSGAIGDTINEMAGTEEAGPIKAITDETQKCVKDNLREEVTRMTLAVTTCGAYDACVSVECSGLAAACCAVKLKITEGTCYCSVRNLKDFATTTDKIIANMNLSEDIIEDDRLLEALASTSSNDEMIIKGGVTEDKEVCGIDYTNWLIRHDLECKSTFDFLSEEEAGEGKGVKKVIDSADDKTVKNKNGIDHILSPFKKEMKALHALKVNDVLDINQGLLSKNSEEWAKIFLKDPKLKTEYEDFDDYQKFQTNKSLRYLSEAIIHLQEMIIANAHADEAGPKQESKISEDDIDKKVEFTSSTKEATVLGGLGLSIVGMFLFPETIKKGMRLTKVFQRTPLRRGLFYLMTYFMASENVKSTKVKIKTVDTQIKTLKQFMKQEGIPIVDDEEAEVDPSVNQPTEEVDPTSGSLYFFKNELRGVLNLIPTAFASTGVFAKNTVPLCIEGESFSTKCTCASTNSCGNEITNTRLRSNLFKIKSFSYLVGAEQSFIKKMAHGKATENDWHLFEKSMSVYSKDIDPIIAAKNLDMAFSNAGMVKPNLINRSKLMLAALQKSEVQKLIKSSGIGINPKEIDFKTDFGTTYNNLIKSNYNDSLTPSSLPTKGQSATARIAKPKIAKPADPFGRKSNRKEESLNEFSLGDNDINSNTQIDLFKIITNRYRQVWFEKKILSFEK